MAVEKLKQLELEGIASALETPEDDPREVSDAAREQFERLVARTLEPHPGPLPLDKLGAHAHSSSGVNGEGEGGHAGPPLPEVGEGVGRWFGQYLELAKAGFTWRVAAYIAWASSPKVNRWPKSQDAFAREVLGLTSDRVIITWRQKNPSIDSTIGQLQSQPLFEHRADVFDALIDSASTKNYKNHQDRKLFLEITGDYNPKIKIEDSRAPGTGEDYSALSDEELRRKVAAGKVVQKSEDEDAGHE